MFFSTNKVNLSNYRELIKLLIKLRIENYPMPEMRKINADPKIKKEIKDLCLHLGSQLIKSELIAGGNEANFLAEKDCFDSILQWMYQSSNFFNFIHYASDLLQFYTLSCQVRIETQHLTTLDTFIAYKAESLGDTSNNLFITECLAIAAYNNLVSIQKAFEKDHFSNEKIKELNIIFSKIEKIKINIEEKIKKSPDNIFAHYLNVVISYSAAKAAKILYQIKADSFDKREKAVFFEPQKSYLKSAACNLDSIKMIQEFTEGVGKPYAPGLQFSLGRSLLRKLPSDNLQLVISHLMQLADSTDVLPKINK